MRSDSNTTLSPVCGLFGLIPGLVGLVVAVKTPAPWSEYLVFGSGWFATCARPQKHLRASRIIVATLLTAALNAPAAFAAEPEPDDLADLSLEQLGSIDVTSVSKKRERLIDAAASIFVITNEDIRRSGATSLPEALRLAPNLQIARSGSAQYAITARGFNNAIGNKLLVLIDGRTVYTPLFSGVFWDQQDILLEDIDRIEVISGPGATLWGANAVNGVINVITRPAKDTQGGFASLGGGNLEKGAAARFGSKLGNNGHFRIYAKTDELQNTVTANGNSVIDGWERMQTGFRADWGGGSDQFTVQGDAYKGYSEDRGTILGFTLGTVKVSGANLLGRWTHLLDDGSDFQVQTYVDYADRDDRVLFRPKSEIFDIEFQHSIPAGAHRVLWGGGYRHSDDEVDPGLFSAFIPDSKELNWGNLFVQDQFDLGASVEATLGIKLAHNDYTGLEHLPSARLAWKPSEQRLIWGAVSRAVRAPSRLDREVFFPNTPPFIVAGGENFVSEVVYVYELGYRSQPSPSLTYSVTAFYHDWDKLRSGTAVIPIALVNDIEGHAYGVEAWTTYQAARNWRLSAGATTLRKELRFKPGTSDPAGLDNDTLHNDPEYFWQLRSSLDLPGNVEFDLGIRHSAKLPHPAVPAYTAVDARVGWHVQKNVELSLTLINLFDPQHPEFGEAPNRPEFERGAYARIAWLI